MIGGAVDRQKIVVVRAPLVDDGRGNQTRDWANAAETESEGWAVDTAAAADDVANRDGASVAYLLRGPYRADVEDTDRVRLFGALYEVTAGVLRQPGVTPRTSHTILQLTRWEG